MKKCYLRLATVTFLFFIVLQKGYSQCASLSTSGTHCDGQRAIFPIPTVGANEELEWFQDAGGTVSDGTQVDATGKHVSRVDVQLGQATKDFWIRRKSPQKVGATSGTTPTGNPFGPNRFGTDVANQRYEMTLNNTTEFTLNSLKVWVKANSNTTVYGLRVRVVLASEVADVTKGQYSDWYKFNGGGSGTYNPSIPANITIPAGGPYIVQVVSETNVAAGVTRVEEMFYNNAASTTTSYLGGSVNIQSIQKAPDNTTTNFAYPLLTDWDITVNCPLTKVTSTLTTTGCCSPVTSITLTAPRNGENASDFPMTITATGDAGASYYYEWYDNLGVLIPSASGVGKTTLSVTAQGSYRVKVVKQQADLNKVSCYKEAPIVLEKPLFSITAAKTKNCVNGKSELTATTNGLFQGWTTLDGETDNIDSPGSLVTTVSPTVPTMYVAKATYQMNNLIKNGDFEGTIGDGYTSSYTQSTSLLPGNYVVGTNPQPYNSYFVSKGDHTSGSGKMYIVDADVDNNKDAYKTTVTVKKGVTYAFSFWIANVHTEFQKAVPDTMYSTQPSKVQFVINNQKLIAVNTKANNAWTQYVQTYTATADATFDIALRNNANPSPTGGNDFALDDIVFAPINPVPLTDTVWVNPCIPPCNPPTTVTIPTSNPTFTGTGANKAIAVCAGTGTLATLNGAYTNTGTPKNSYQYSWYKEGTTPTYVNNTTVAAKTLTAADSGTWVLRVEDYNGSLSSATCYKEDKVKLTVTARPTFTVGTSTICGGSVSLDTLVKNLKPASSTLLFYSDTTGASPTPINKVVTVGGKYFARATGPTPTSCTSKFVEINITINPKPAKPTIAVDQTLPFCVGNARNLTATTATAGATFQWSGDGTSATAIQAAKTTLGTSTYIVQATANGCKSDTASVKVTINPLPTATISGSGEYCKEAVRSLPIVLTGKAPFTLTYTDNATVPTSITPATTSDAISVPATIAGTFTLTKISDANGCSSTPSGATAVATITRTPDLLITNISAVCDFNTKQATVKFDVTGGKPAYTFPTPVPTSGGAFATPTYTASFTANGITNYDYRVSDASGCTANTNYQGPKTNINCACPVTGVIDSVAGSNTSICNDGVATTKIKVTVANSSETTPVYDFVIKTPSGTLTKAQATTVVGNVYTYDVKEGGIYTIQSVGDQGCQGSGSGSVTVKLLPDPKATITATDPTYCKDGVDKGLVTINVTNPSKASYTVVVGRTTGGDTTLTLTSTTGTIASGTDNTFTLKSLKDAAGCSAKAANLTGSAALTGTTPPVAIITAPAAVTSPGTGNYTFNKSPFTGLVATDPGTSYIGAWAVSRTSGTGTPVLTGSNSSLTNGINGMDFNDEAKVTWTVSDPSAVCTVPAVATINVIRKPITEALAKNDTICISNGAYNELASIPNSALGELPEWTAVGSAPAPQPGIVNLVVNFTAPGIYQYTYRIYNPTILDGAGNPIESKNTYTIYVDDLATTADADTTNGSLQICTSPYTLKGNWPKASKGETGQWTGNATFVDATQNVSNITNLVDGTSYPLTWTISSRYKVCPSSSDNITYVKLKDITKPVIDTIPDVCVSTPAVSVKANDANALNNETGAWTSVPGGIIPAADVNKSTLSLTGLAKGTYTVIWTISSTTCPGGPTDAMTFRVDDVPTLGGITAVNPACEGNTGDYTANGASAKFAFDLTYKWTTTSASAGNPTRNPIGPTDQPNYKVEFLSSLAYLEELDSATVVLELSNTCGTAKATTPVIWRLRPRKVGVIGGSDAICGSDLGYYTYGIEAQPNTTIYNWRFAGDTLTNIVFPGPPETDSTMVRPGKWAGVSSPAIISLRLENACGKAADSTTKPVIIIAPAPLQAVLGTVSNALPNDASGSQKVCLPEYPVVLNASSPNAGADALYTYYVDNTIIAGPTDRTSFQISKDSLTHGKNIWVKVSSEDGCFISTSPGVNLSDPSNIITIDGYEIDTTLTASSLAICDGSNQSILLSVPNSKGNTSYAWSKDGAPYPSTISSVTLTDYEQSGRYHVVINNSVCPSKTSKDTTVRIYDLPNPEFVPSPFVIYYDQSSTGTVMPLITEGTRDSLRTIHYSPDFFLSSGDSLRPIIKTESQEFTQEYVLTLTTGPLNNPTLCPNTGKITVINALPLRVPNAFSPNNDGKNDTWVIDGLGKYKDLKVYVYNRWGNSMFTDKDGVYVPWDGTTNGAELASGTYYYVIELKGSPDGTDGTNVGSLTIVR